MILVVGGLIAVVALLVAGAAGAAPTSATVAESTAVGFRAVVVVTKTSGGRAPSASASVAAYETVGGKWKPLGHVRIGGPNGFFWKVLTGPRAIRQFSISSATPQQVSVRLLVTPALGWSPVYHFHVRNGRLVAGA